MSILDISVIIPIYNAEKYLQKCIDSILAQTFTNFELLLIDDGSCDNSGKICDDFARKYTFIHVIHKENGGVSSARNCGIEHASGTYVVFVDADDWVDINYLECLFPKKEEDLVCCSFSVEDHTFGIRDWNVALTDCQEATKALSENLTKFAFCSVTCKSFKKYIIAEKNVRFHEDISQCEDGLFVFDYLCAIHCCIKTQSKIAYHYRYDNKERGTYAHFPMHQSYKLMDLLSNRLEHIQNLYNCPNAWYLQGEMIYSQMYNIFQTVNSNGNTVWWKIREYIALLKNKHVHYLLTDKNYMKMKRRGLAKYYLMRLFYSIV